MRNASLLCVVTVLVVSVSSAFAAEVTLNGHVFTIPDGFEIELVAGPPLVDRPITAAFDERGRLYVADSSGTNDKVAKQLEDRPHRIVRLEDTNGDGKFDKSLVYADKMMFPEGTMWLDGSLYVAAPPSIWKLTDTDDDGVADKREEWFKGNTLTGCANDLHGPYLGPDGWIYWCKGAFAKQTYARDGKSLRQIKDGETPKDTWSTRASHIFRARPDGSGLEVVMTGGMDNPVDVTFTASGERILTNTFFQQPGGGRRDGLIHAIYGGVYGKQHDVVEEHKRTGELMPVLTHMGPAAPCGLTTITTHEMGIAYYQSILACQFNLRKVTRHILEIEGATFSTRDFDFVVSNNLDFHPTDVLEDPAGGILVVDTGGWYKLCCPTSQLHKPDVLGAIYRVRPRREKGPKPTVEGRNPALMDVGSAHAERTIQRYARRGKDAIPEIMSMDHERNAGLFSASLDTGRVWALNRIDDPDARSAIRSFLFVKNDAARQAALNCISLWRDKEAVADLIKLLNLGSAPNRRGAAEALGRIGDKAAVAPLLASVEWAKDRAGEHAIIYALIEIADPVGTAKGLASDNPAVRRVALIALDQMEGGGLEPKQVAALLTSPEPVLKETAAWIVGRHSEWGGQLSSYMAERLAAKDVSAADRTEFEKQLAQFAKHAAVQELLASAASGKGYSVEARRSALVAMRASGLKELPPAWLATIVATLADETLDLAALAVSVPRSVPAAKGSAAELATALQLFARKKGVSPAARLEALAATPGGISAVDSETFAFLRGGLSSDNAVGTRAMAADVLAKAKLDKDQLMTLTESLATAGPLEADRLLAAFEQSTDESLGLAVVAVLKDSSARGGLRADAVRARLAKYPAAVQKGALEVAALLNVNLAMQQAKLEELISATKGGDVRRGQAVFMRNKLACNVCHQFGYVGGNVGPDLTRIGGIRSERDLLESIVFPSASFVRSYEPVTVVTSEGKTHSGLLRKDAPDEIILATSATETVRIPREDVELLKPSTVSIMPSGLDQQLTVQELADLVAFLKNAK